MLVLQVHEPTISLDHLGHNMSNMKIKGEREREKSGGILFGLNMWTGLSCLKFC